MGENRMTIEERLQKIEEITKKLEGSELSLEESLLEFEKGTALIREAEEALGDDGRVLVRESGTEPVLRVMAEAKTDALCEETVNGIIAVIREQGLILSE